MSNSGSSDRDRSSRLWLSRVDNLPPFPGVVLEALDLLDDERSSGSDIAAAIGKDEAITAKILRVVNSAFYGVRGQVTTVSHAVTLLGFEQLRTVMMGVVLLELGQTHDPGAAWNRKMVWEHSWTTAKWAQALARATQYQSAEEASVAGLLHDVGKIVIGTSAPRDFTEAVALSSNTGLASWEAEDRVVGINHVETGKMVAERWRFPQVIRDAIARHHSPWPPAIDRTSSENRRLVHLLAVIRVADGAAKDALGEHPYDSTPENLPIGSERLAEKVTQVDLLLRS